MSREVNLRGIAAVPLAIGTFIGSCGAASAPTAPPEESLPSLAPAALPEKALSSLPPEATKTWRLIQSDGPFPYRRDGVVFQNRERILPQQKRGYYHEYTVPTPGSPGRGARRLVTGAGVDELYYTGDHYRSFVAVDVKR
ncbi:MULTISPECIES: ribonuclease domain-containing protein [Nonomuraea]|uniref:Ribonuclease domain-containing protein n=1 Tax=Nonomuraea mangrovi TaxID=2316207 RepID=A0ABW4T5C6_9ACTN